jgi:hypothetical protein
MLKKSKAIIGEPIRSHDDMRWIISFVMEVGACVASTMEEIEWNVQGKSITCRAFYFTGQRLCRKVHDQV